MLFIEAKIKFYIDSTKREFNAKGYIRPIINFEGNLFTGEISSNGSFKTYEQGKEYDVSIVQPTITSEAFETIKNVVSTGYIFKIQEGERIIGEGIIKDWVFDDE